MPQIADLRGTALVHEATPKGLLKVHLLCEVSVGAAVHAMAVECTKLVEKSGIPLAAQTLGPKSNHQLKIDQDG